MKKLILFMSVFLFFTLVSAVPTPHAIQGYVYYENGEQVPLGTPVTIKVHSNTIQTQTFAPPGHTGFYATTVNAEDGDLAVVTVSSDGQYGKSFGKIQTGTITIDVHLKEKKILKFFSVKNTTFYRNIKILNFI